jgi:hypothetical protein
MRVLFGVLMVVSLTVWAVVAQAADPGDIIINEVMQNPNAVYDDHGEWFELYNTTSSGIDIDGWTIRDDDLDSHTIDNGGPLVVPAKGYLVLGCNADPDSNGGYTCDYEYGSGWYLANSADEVVLEDGLKAEIARINYDGGTDWPDPTGASMGWTGPPGIYTDGTDWVEETTATYGDGDYGTPGYLNTDSTLPVDLSSFTASYSPGMVTLRWRTELEVNNLGFYVLRALEREGEYQPVSGLIPGHGSSLEPHQYVYQDIEILSNTMYYYELRQVDMEGREVIYGPISIFTGATSVDRTTWGKIKSQYR